MQRRRLFAGAASAAGAAALFGTPLTGLAATLLRMNFQVGKTDPLSVEFLRFVQLVGQRSNGSIQIDTYYNGALGSADDTVTATQSGVLDLALSAISSFDTRFKQCQVVDLPFVFSSRANLWKVMDSDFGRGLTSDMAQQGFIALAWGAYGDRNLGFRDKSVAKPDDMHGLRMRVINSPTSVSMLRAFGAVPVNMAFSETFLAFQQKALDGLDGSIDAFIASKINEVCKYVSLTNHSYANAVILMSKRRYDTLPPDQQKALQDAARDFTPGWRQMLETSTARATQEWARLGGTVVQVDRAAFIKAFDPVYDEYRTKLGTDYVNRMLRLGRA